jgi:signal transduction histidine kinase
VLTSLRPNRLIPVVESLVCAEAEDDDTRTRKAHFTLAMALIIPAGVLWGLLYLGFGARSAALLPLSYSVLSTLDLAVLRRTRAFRPFQISQIVLIIALPFGLQLALGGFVGGSAVVVWGFLGPLLAVLTTSPREAALWFVTFLATVLVAGVAQSSLDVTNDLPAWLVRALFVMNLGAVSAIAFSMLVSFVGARDRLRSLERAYLEQNVMLRQREKLATLGTLAAGVAHELNNPAAAVQRSAEQLRPTLAEITRHSLELSDHRLMEAAELIDPPTPRPAATLSTLELAGREQELEDWLDRHDVDGPWELAPVLVALGCTIADLDALAARVDPSALDAGVSFLAQTATAASLSDGIVIAARRISEIVSALRSYSYLDRGTWQTVDVTEGIDSTLVLMQAKLGDMRVERRYAADLPPIEVRGNELNQVWTNIIDNAIGATGGAGTLVVRTFMSDGHVVAELEDDGPGMPPAVAERVFDPFFTTKPPGSGTGLGLNISHNIVVRQHAGEISVSSEPGRTCFRVELPVTHPREGNGRAEEDEEVV